MAKCPECPACAVPEYMLTYGDMMTLLLTFFVLLLSFANMDRTKFEQAIGSLKGALGVLKANKATVMPSRYTQTYKKMKKAESAQLKEKLEALKREIMKEAQKAGVSDKVMMDISKDQIHFRLSEDVLFDSGSAQIKSGADSLFAVIGDVLKLVPYETRVEGHTDNVPISSGRYRDNWDLSTDRALSVVRRFIGNGIDPTRFQAIGYGEYKPIADNASPDGRKMNRRVEIFINLADETTTDLPDLDKYLNKP